MTEFKRVSEEVVAVEAALSSESGDAATLVSRLLAVQPAVDRFFKRAQEPDPEKRLYNASMTAKINELHARHGQLLAQAQSRASTGSAASAGATPAAASVTAVAEDAERAAAELREKEARRKAQEAEALAQRQREEAAKAAEVAAAVEKFKREQADKAAAKEAEKEAKETADKVRSALLLLRAATFVARIRSLHPSTALQSAHVTAQRLAVSSYCRVSHLVCAALRYTLRHTPLHRPVLDFDYPSVLHRTVFDHDASPCHCSALARQQRRTQPRRRAWHARSGQRRRRRSQPPRPSRRRLHQAAG